MSSYSVDGYISALTIREKHTLLVEGRSDRALICRILLELQEKKRVDRTDLVVDSAELLRGEGASYGNRVLVELVYERASADGVELLAVVDREFRGFSDTEPVDGLKGHMVKSPGLYWTKGHSTENYFFEPDYFTHFIKHQFASRIEPSAFTKVHECFPSALKWACAVGLALRDCELLERSKDLKQSGLWSLLPNGDVSLSAERFAETLRTRGVAQDALEKLKTAIHHHEVFLSGLGTTADFQWLTHGHTGWTLLWGGLGTAIGVLCQMPNDVKQIEGGQNETKVNCASDLLAFRIAQGEADMLPDLWNHLENLVPGPAICSEVT